MQRYATNPHYQVAGPGRSVDLTADDPFMAVGPGRLVDLTADDPFLAVRPGRSVDLTADAHCWQSG